MHAHRGRFLIPLILLIAALCCNWTAAHAAARLGSRSDAQSVVIGSKSGAMPLSVSGEPDVPQQKQLPQHGALNIGTRTEYPSSRGDVVSERLFWIVRLWVARYWGIK